MNNLLMYIMIPVVLVPYFMLIRLAYAVIEREDKVAEDWVKAGAKYRAKWNAVPVQLLAAPEVQKQRRVADHHEAA